MRKRILVKRILVLAFLFTLFTPLALRQRPMCWQVNYGRTTIEGKANLYWNETLIARDLPQDVAFLAWASGLWCEGQN